MLMTNACGDNAAAPKPPEPFAVKAVAANISDANSDATRMQCGTIEFPKPAAWQWVKPTAQFRTLQYRVPGAHGDAELIVSAFASGDGGGVQPNIERWQNQFRAADGSPAVAQQSEVVINGMQVTRVNLAGAFKGMGQQQGTPGTAQLGVIVQAAQQTIFIRLIGPQATVDQARADFERMVLGVKLQS